MHGGPFDVGARLTVALARPVGRIIGSTADEVRETVKRTPRSAYDLCLSSVMRATAWLITAVSVLLLYFVAGIIEDFARETGPNLIRDWGGAPAIVAAITGSITAVRVGVTYYMSDALWERGGVVLHWFLAPGNKDLLVAIAITALGAVAISS